MIKKENKTTLPELAKKAFCLKRGFKNGPSKSYADLVINERGEDIFYEIKATSMTKQEYESILAKTKKAKTKYFGAATLTEWNKALKNPQRYRFVLVVMDKENPETMLGYEEYSPDELLAYSTVPPFKVNFNIPIKKDDTMPNRRPETVSASDLKSDDQFKRLSELIKYYTETLNGVIRE